MSHLTCFQKNGAKDTLKDSVPINDIPPPVYPLPTPLILRWGIFVVGQMNKGPYVQDVLQRMKEIQPKDSSIPEHLDSFSIAQSGLPMGTHTEGEGVQSWSPVQLYPDLFQYQDPGLPKIPIGLFQTLKGQVVPIDFEVYRIACHLVPPHIILCSMQRNSTNLTYAHLHLIHPVNCGTMAIISGTNIDAQTTIDGNLIFARPEGE